MHAAMLNQYNFNIIKSEPTERISPYEYPIGSGGSFPSLYPMTTTSPQSQSTIQTLRPQVSPDRTSPMDYRLYNPALIQSQPSPQYPSTSSHILQQPSIRTYTQQQFPYVHDTLQIQPQEQLTLSKVTSNYHEEFQSLNNAVGEMEATNVTNILSMDNTQYNLDLSLPQLDSTELADLDISLSENLSSGLSISDSTKPETSKGINAEPSNIEESNNMTDSFTRIANNTIQELYTLNNIYKPTREVD